MAARLGEHARARAVAETAEGPVALAGGKHGLELWSLDSAERLASHRWKVEALATADPGGQQPLALASHHDGMVTLHELPSLRMLAGGNTTAATMPTTTAAE